ncbi:hypothetical protein AVEN_33892-1 [Araneus ventricosus]|uniref:Uncharacterized protein n=1 Tax=Araneus ventricosus TaxID=182803 RepID=A0A4Y2EKB5_ARAVE|nr:hypothetical protein AVEN_33892-1 [Araneus ventricosus]
MHPGNLDDSRCSISCTETAVLVDITDSSRRIYVLSLVGGPNAPPLLYPSGKLEPTSLSEAFSPVNSWFPRDKSYPVIIQDLYRQDKSSSKEIGRPLDWTTGYPDWTAGYPDWTTGYPDWTTGYPDWTTCYPDWTTGYPEWTTGYPEWTTGYPEWTTGFQDWIAGYPNLTTG